MIFQYTVLFSISIIQTYKKRNMKKPFFSASLSVFHIYIFNFILLMNLSKF